MKDSCEEVLRRVETYLDGELAEPEAAAIAEHLDACPECMEHEVFLSRLRAIVRAKLRSPQDTHEPLVEQIRSMIAAG